MQASGKLRHVVMFGFQSDAPPSRIAELIERFRALKDLVPGVEDFECGANVSPEGLSQGYSHCFVLTFASDAARDAYLPHPSHLDFVNWIGSTVEKALVVDYWAS